MKASLNNGGRSEEEDLLNNDDILNEDCDNYLRRNPLEFVGIFVLISMRMGVGA